MIVEAIQLTANAKPLLNNTFINTQLKEHELYELTIADGASMIKVHHKTKGVFMIPLTSVSWFRPAKITAAVTAATIVTPKKRRTRQKPAASTVSTAIAGAQGAN